MVFTLVVMSIVMTIFLYSFNIELSRKMRNHSEKSIELEEDVYSKKREYLLARLNKYIKGNFGYINESNLDSVLCKINEENITFEDAFVKFDDVNKKIILNLKDQKGIVREESYSYTLDQKLNLVKFKIFNIKYR